MVPTKIKYMSRCLQLAKSGEALTAPNPMVGSVIVYRDQIIGEGYHQKYGGYHAEVNAIGSVKDKGLLAGSTLYVNLEPCSHYGKTPPCANLIIENKIPKIVIGTLDPNPLVAGKGVKMLIEAGCDVDVGCMTTECRELNRRFFTFQEKRRPFIILKWAQTLDGFVDTKRDSSEYGRPNWITDDIARIAVHRQRSTESAILIGTTTALADNPSLTIRDWYGKQPLRIVFDMDHKLPSTLNIFNGQGETLTCTPNIYDDNRKTGYFIMSPNGSIETLLDELFRLNIQSVIVEGGPKTLSQFIDSGIWDEAHIYTGFITFGKGIKAPEFDNPVSYEEYFKKSKLSVYTNYKK